MDKPDPKHQVIDEIDRLYGELTAVSSKIHANPELGFEEYQAVEWLTDLLRQHGFSVETGIAGLPTAFKASFKVRPGGPSVAFLAEYDALAKMGHACGHNIMGAASVGAAIAVSKVIAELPGEVLVFGTPAEETGAGKALMVDQGVFDGVDVAMMVHPGTRTRVVTRALASVTLDVEFVGKPAHAAARPEDGINALDAMILSYNSINALRQHIRGDARIHGIITNGGEAPNIVPSYSSARFYVRADDDPYLDALLERVIHCFRAGAEATGATLRCNLAEARYSPMRTNHALAEAFAANYEKLGVAVQPPDTSQSFGSTDMGNVSQVVPSIHPFIAIAPESVSNHSPEFAAAAVSEEGHRGLIDSAKAMAMTAVDVLSDGRMLARIKEEFVRGGPA